VAHSLPFTFISIYSPPSVLEKVCFDKGLTLRVPEVVPCRLTPLLVAALGPAAVEDGRFRAAAEAALGALRGSHEAVLGLLEAFAHDPLLDW